MNQKQKHTPKLEKGMSVFLQPPYVIFKPPYVICHISLLTNYNHPQAIYKGRVSLFKVCILIKILDMFLFQPPLWLGCKHRGEDKILYCDLFMVIGGLLLAARLEQILSLWMMGGEKDISKGYKRGQMQKVQLGSRPAHPS